ncbi:fibronectin type III domain containing protein [Syntrophus aciditrophicus SB]|uniref:Fibronectin type III domain containing protein n=2 Tax=Syntrophus TaxID=43773 RepID=Q2LUR8_SYNAS|nr:fibronectin type III domain containing protein [Syntrophus aciditrophicus SB]
MSRKCSGVWVMAFLLSVLIILQGCLAATKNTVISPQIRQLFQGTYVVDPYMEKHTPRTVAVLPFRNSSNSQAGSNEVRKGFYNHFSSLPFKDMELHRVDDLLLKAGLTDPGVIRNTSPVKLGEILGVDAVVFGEISNFDRLFALVYSQVSVGAEIRMYDAKTGHFLWSGKHVTRIHEGGVSTTPVGLIATVVATSMNIRDIQLLRACDDLFREMVKTLPVPHLAEALRPPGITLLTQDTQGKPKKAGEEIRVVIQGTPKMRASFDIGDFRKHVDMREIEPGGYLGIYKVVPGDNLSRATIVGTLRDDSGNAVQWVDAVGTVTLDTKPPEKIAEARAVGRNRTILLNWTKGEATDLAGYKVYRSKTPLTGYEEIAKTEVTQWRDEGLENLQPYYYRITAFDEAGNESEATDALEGVAVAPGPTPVSGRIETDTVWYSGASPYVLEKDVTVADKARLVIEPGTEVRSREGALIIEGRIEVQGDREHIVNFDVVEGKKTWPGLRFVNVRDKENPLRFCRIRGAETAVACLSSSPRIETCELLENGVALHIDGAFSKPRVVDNIISRNREAAILIVNGAQPLLEGNRIQDNEREGVRIQSSAPVIRHNLVTRNRGTGILVNTSQAAIRENNLFDNTPLDMAADSVGEPADGLLNWWGTVRGAELFSRISGRISVGSVLSAPWPQGKPIPLNIPASDLGGSISRDAFLIPANSPYQVKRDVVIDGGAILHIEPGVEIRYDPHTSIIVEDGAVEALGTSDRPVLFTASGQSPTPGSYSTAIHLAKPTKANSIFRYCVFKYADIALDISFGSPEISWCHITKNAQNGVFCRNDVAPRISYSTFEENTGEGAIKCVGMSRPKINFNNFLRNEITDIQAFSSIRIDASRNWWGSSAPDDSGIFRQNEDGISIKPWLKAPQADAFAGRKDERDLRRP